jgi:hypothetical protein
VRLSSVITHGNIRDEVSRDAADQADDREFSIALSPIHDVFSGEGHSAKGKSTRMYAPPYAPM